MRKLTLILAAICLAGCSRPVPAVPVADAVPAASGGFDYRCIEGSHICDEAHSIKPHSFRKIEHVVTNGDQAQLNFSNKSYSEPLGTGDVIYPGTGVVLWYPEMETASFHGSNGWFFDADFTKYLRRNGQRGIFHFGPPTGKDDTACGDHLCLSNSADDFEELFSPVDIDISHDGVKWFHLLGERDCFYGAARITLSIGDVK